MLVLVESDDNDDDEGKAALENDDELLLFGRRLDAAEIDLRIISGGMKADILR